MGRFLQLIYNYFTIQFNRHLRRLFCASGIRITFQQMGSAKKQKAVLAIQFTYLMIRLVISLFSVALQGLHQIEQAAVAFV